MEKARMLGMEKAVAGGTEGGRRPIGVPPTNTAARSIFRKVVPAISGVPPTFCVSWSRRGESTIRGCDAKVATDKENAVAMTSRVVVRSKSLCQE